MATPTRATATLTAISRRTAVFGASFALVLGIAVPAFADSGSAPKPGAKPAAAAVQQVPMSQLVHGKPSHQTTIKLDKWQKANAARIVKAAKELKLPARAAVIAVATAMQESTLHNYGNLGRHNDHDSVGLFQQRPSAGWGSMGQCKQPDHAAKSFLGRLTKVHNWNKMPLTKAAQSVQVSAYGDRYAKWESEAAGLVETDFTNGS